LAALLPTAGRRAPGIRRPDDDDDSAAAAASPGAIAPLPPGADPGAVDDGERGILATIFAGDDRRRDDDDGRSDDDGDDAPTPGGAASGIETEVSRIDATCDGPPDGGAASGTEMEDSRVFGGLDDDQYHDGETVPSIVGGSRLDVASRTTSTDLRITTDSGEVLDCTADGEFAILPPPSSFDEDFVAPSQQPVTTSTEDVPQRRRDRKDAESPKKRSFLLERTWPKKKTEVKSIPRVRVEEHVLSNDAATPKLPKKDKSSTFIRIKPSGSPTGVADWQKSSADSTTEASALGSLVYDSSFLSNPEINDPGCCSVAALFDVFTFNLKDVVDRIDDVINGYLEKEDDESYGDLKDDDESSSDESKAESSYEDDRAESRRRDHRPVGTVSSSSNTRKYSSIGGRSGRASLNHRLRGLQRNKSDWKRKDDGREQSRRYRSVPRRGKDIDGPPSDYAVRLSPGIIPVEGLEVEGSGANNSFDNVEFPRSIHELRGIQRRKSLRKRKGDGRERSRRSRSVPRRGKDTDGPPRDYAVRFSPGIIPAEGSEEADDSFDKVLRLP
jgi:hypothetical protein